MKQEVRLDVSVQIGSVRIRTAFLIMVEVQEDEKVWASPNRGLMLFPTLLRLQVSNRI